MAASRGGRWRSRSKGGMEWEKAVIKRIHSFMFVCVFWKLK